MDCCPPGSSIHGVLQARTLEWVAMPCPPPSVLPNAGIKSGLPHCRQILYHLNHQGSPKILQWVAYSFSRISFQPRNWAKVSCAELPGNPTHIFISSPVVWHMTELIAQLLLEAALSISSQGKALAKDWSVTQVFFPVPATLSSQPNKVYQPEWNIWFGLLFHATPYL